MSMQSILAASQSMSRMQAIQSARTQMQGAANVMRIESKQDDGNEKKDAKADALEQKSSNLMGNLMKEATDVTETLKPDENVKTEEQQEAKRAEKGQRTDKVTLSDYAAGHTGAAPALQPVVGKAVSYRADGSKVPGAAADTAPSFETTA